MAYRSNEPYNGLPGLPPRVPMETTRVMRRCVTASRALAERKTASFYLRELERIGILVGEKRGREVIYQHPALLEILTA